MTTIASPPSISADATPSRWRYLCLIPLAWRLTFVADLGLAGICLAWLGFTTLYLLILLLRYRRGQ